MSRRKPSSFISSTLIVLLAAGSAFPPGVVHAQGLAPCPGSTPPNANPPSSRVVFTILSVNPESDLEGDDDYIPFYDNHADVYGTVVIDGQEFALPEVSETDDPFWGPGNGRFEKPVTSSP